MTKDHAKMKTSIKPKGVERPHLGHVALVEAQEPGDQGYRNPEKPEGLGLRA